MATPFDSSLLQHTFRRIEGYATKNEIYEYALIIGKFIYSAYMARPDIAFAISIWARFISNPTDIQQKGLKRLPRYLRNTIRRAIKYRNVKEHPHGLYNSLGLFAAVNASYALDPKKRKLVIGYVIFMGGGPVIWRSHRQLLITKASGAAKYVAASEATNDLTWIRIFFLRN
jgi:hypothetical protein